MKKVCFSLFFFFCLVTLQAQKYGFIQDYYKYIPVKDSPSSKGIEIDTLFNLQIVQIDESFQHDKWSKISYFYEEEPLNRYIPTSRIIPLPDTYNSFFDLYFDDTDPNTKHFVMGVDCPHILLTIEFEIFGINYSTLRAPYKEINDYSSDPEYPLIRLEGMHDTYIFDIENKNTLFGWEVPYLLRDMMIYNEKIIVSDPYSQLFFYKNDEGKTVRELISLIAHYPPLPEEELQVIIQLAENTKQAIEQLEEENPNPWFEAESIMREQFGDTFTKLSILRQAYMSGDKKAQKLYPFILTRFPCDAAGCQDLELFYTRELFIKRHQGTRILD